MIYCFGDCALDVARHELRRAGRIVALEPRGFQVLTYLLQHGDRVVTKEELFAHCWPDMFVTDSALTRCLVKIRKAVRSDRRAPPVIQTIHGQGYRFVAPLTTHPTHAAPTPDSAIATLQPPLVFEASPSPASTGAPQDNDLPATILAVDDEVKNVKLLEALLVPRGYRVVQAFDGMAGVRHACANPADAIILDYQMPHGNGDYAFLVNLVHICWSAVTQGLVRSLLVASGWQLP